MIRTLLPQRHWFPLTIVVTLVLAFLPVGLQATQPAPGADLPTIKLDALDPYRWSLSELFVAPGQTIVITNRGVLSHDFTVPEWGMQVDLPTLEPVEIVVPLDLQPGDQFSFFCSEPGHQANGQKGVVTVVSAEEAIANAATADTRGDSSRVVVETRDNFSWSPSAFSISPGQFIEVRNTGVLEHHFVVDAWNINVTVSAGEVQLVQAPMEITEGEVFTFYCSVPGHQAGGMEGTITVVATAPLEGGPSPGGADRRGEPNIDQFLPDASVLGTGWELVRTGNARSVLANYDNVSAKVFPGEGRGATYVGPSGSRATIVVLPFAPAGIPTNQVEDAVVNVQLLLMVDWDADLRDSSSLNLISPPAGCEVANRQSGITRIYTLPAGSTVCQLRTAGIAIFVAIEGVYGEVSGVAAADQLVIRLLEAA